MTDYARLALLAVVEHWPGRLDHLALRGHGEVSRPGLAGVNVWRGADGLLLHFRHQHLAEDSPALAHVARSAYRRWHTGLPEPDSTPDHARVALRVVVEHWPGVLDGVALTGELMRSAVARVLVMQDGQTLQVGFTRHEVEHPAAPATAAHVALAYRAWQSPPPEPRDPPYAE